MDNAAFRKGAEMKKAIERAEHTLLYLPPSSPDLNPIEKKWPQAKNIRKAKQCTIQKLFQCKKLYRINYGTVNKLRDMLNSS
jgi:transposase